MATKVADVHVNITTNASGNQIVFHNPGQAVLPPSAGAPVTAAVKPVGTPNGSAHGQVANSSVVFHNPAAIFLALCVGSMLQWMS